MKKPTTKTPPPAAEAVEVRDSRQAYAAALADRLSDLLHDGDADDHPDEVLDLVRSLAFLLHRRRADGCGR